MKRALFIVLIMMLSLVFMGCNSKSKEKVTEETVEIVVPSTESTSNQVPENNPPSSSSTEKSKPAVTSGKNEIDEWLDGYEAVVVAYERAGKPDINDMMEINEKLAELNEKTNDGDMTPAQMTRLTKLINRLSKVMSKMN